MEKVGDRFFEAKCMYFKKSSTSIRAPGMLNMASLQTALRSSGSERMNQFCLKLLYTKCH